MLLYHKPLCRRGKDKMKMKRALIKKLRTIVSMGYVPHRELENYFYTTQSNQDVCSIVNCFGHACFNLTNEQIEQLGINESHGQFFGTFASEETTPDIGLERQVVNFVKKTGLEIRPISKYEGGLDNNQWKVAMYIDHSGLGLFAKDFHFFRQEKDGTWTHKMGYFSNVEQKDFPGEKYQRYDYYKTFVITNPYAREL